MVGTKTGASEQLMRVYQDRPARAKNLRAEGRKVIGYLHMYPVLEMLTAADLVPYGLLGDMSEPITEADACLPTIVCPFLRSLMDLGLKGRFDFLDGVVMAHMCEVGEKLAHIWRTYLKPPYAYFLDTPHTTGPAALKQHKEQLKEFRRSLEKLTGKEISADRIRSAIRLHNEQRVLVKQLYDLKKPDPPLISGVDTLKVLIAVMSLPIDEGNDLLRRLVLEIKDRPNPVEAKPARLLLWGSMIDDPALIEMIEGTGANVVMDDIWVGSRAFFPEVVLTDDPLDGLVTHYLVDVRSPRTVSPPQGLKKDYMADLERRFGYIRKYAQDWKANGVIVQSMRYCDIHAYEVPALKDYLEHVGLPNIYLEDSYNKSALAPMKTRVQAFLEVIGA